MQRFLNWLNSRFFADEEPLEGPLFESGAHVAPPTVRPVKVTPKPRPEPEPETTEELQFTSEVGGRIDDGGPGKNVLIRNKYVREDTGTHETLQIIDDSILDSEDEFGADPYNTGRFDRSKSWDSSRHRK